MGREMTDAAALALVGGTFRLGVDLYAHVAGDPVIGATGPAERPTVVVERFRPTETHSTEGVTGPRTRPAAVNLDVAGGLLVDSRGRLEHRRLHISGVRRRHQRNACDRSGD